MICVVMVIYIMSMSVPDDIQKTVDDLLQNKAAKLTNFTFQRMQPPFSANIDFMHIPKTGGTSLAEDLKTWNISFNGNKESSWLNEYIQQSQYVFAEIREPKSHLVSQWKWCRRPHHLGQVKNKMERVPFTSWTNYWSHLAQHWNGSIEMTHFENWLWPSIKHNNWDIDPDPFGCGYIPVNLQATRLGVFTAEAVRDRVQEMFHVGVLDMYTESLCVLHFKVHNFTHDGCEIRPSCAVRAGTIAKSTKKVNSAEERGDNQSAAELLAEADEKDLERLTSSDQVAYAVAKERLEREIEYVQEHFDEKFLSVCDA